MLLMNVYVWYIKPISTSLPTSYDLHKAGETLFLSSATAIS